jgi:hypothetical protein
MKFILNILLLVALIVGLSACEHKVSMETTVHEDGSLDKTIVLEVEDTTRNFLGIGGESGWNVKTRLIEDSAKEKREDAKKKWSVTYQKKFTSSEEANADLATPSDSLFRISSTFDKKFRWFYTYLYYADTYKTINRMTLPPNDYVVQEDYAFIDRLPAEGQTISKADSFYLSEMHKRIFDVYGIRAIYEAHYDLDVRLIKESGLENRWIDTLRKHKESIYGYLNRKQDVPDDFMYKAMDSLGIPFPFNKMRAQYDELYRQEDAKTNFINHANEGKYMHVINMPWTIVGTNADSVSGNRLIWNPPSIKFLLKDYTMYGEARKVNFWAFLISAAVLFFTGYLFWRRR